MLIFVFNQAYWLSYVTIKSTHLKGCVEALNGHIPKWFRIRRTLHWLCKQRNDIYQMLWHNLDCHEIHFHTPSLPSNSPAQQYWYTVIGLCSTITVMGLHSSGKANFCCETWLLVLQQLIKPSMVTFVCEIDLLGHILRNWEIACILLVEYNEIMKSPFKDI